MRKLVQIVLFLLLARSAFGAITSATLASSNNTSDLSSYNTASQTPTANRLVLATIVSHPVAAETANQPTLTGNGLTWVAVNTRTAGTGTIARVTVFRAMGASPSAGAVTIDFAGQSQNVCMWIIAEFAGIDTSGTNGSGAIVQSVNNGATSTSLTVTLAAFGSASNATYGAFCHLADESVTQGTGFTEIGDWRSTSLLQGSAQWKNSSDTTVDASWTSSVASGGVAIEIKEAVTTGASAIHQRRRRY